MSALSFQILDTTIFTFTATLLPPTPRTSWVCGCSVFRSNRLDTITTYNYNLEDP